MVLPMAGIWGKIDYDEKIFDCGIKPNTGIDPVPVVVGMGVLITWIISLAVYIYIRLKVKNKVEENKIYLRKLSENNFDIANDPNAVFHQRVIDMEKNDTRTVTSLIMAFSCASLPCM